MPDQTLFTFGAISKRWSVSKDTLHRAEKNGTLKTVRLAGRVLIHLDEIHRVEREGLGTGRHQRLNRGLK